MCQIRTNKTEIRLHFCPDTRSEELSKTGAFVGIRLLFYEGVVPQMKIAIGRRFADSNHVGIKPKALHSVSRILR